MQLCEESVKSFELWLTAVIVTATAISARIFCLVISNSWFC